MRLGIETGGGCAEGAGDAERIAHVRAAARDGVAALNGTKQGDIEDELLALVCPHTRDVAAHDGCSERFGFQAHTGIDLLQQVKREMRRDDERDQSIARLPAHRGNIAQVDGQRLASNLLWAAALKREMHSLYLAIDSRQQKLLAADIKNGGIVTHAQHDTDL